MRKNNKNINKSNFNGNKLSGGPRGSRVKVLNTKPARMGTATPKILRQGQRPIDYTLQGIKRAADGRLPLIGKKFALTNSFLAQGESNYVDASLTESLFDVNSSDLGQYGCIPALYEGIIEYNLTGYIYDSGVGAKTPARWVPSAYTQGIITSADDFAEWLANNAYQLKINNYIFQSGGKEITDPAELEQWQISAQYTAALMYQSDICHTIYLMRNISYFVSNYQFLRNRFWSNKDIIDANYNKLMNNSQFLGAWDVVNNAIKEEYVNPIVLKEIFKLKPSITGDGYDRPLTDISLSGVTIFSNLSTQSVKFDPTTSLGIKIVNQIIPQTQFSRSKMLSHSFTYYLTTALTATEINNCISYFISFARNIQVSYGPVKSGLTFLAQSKTGITWGDVYQPYAIDSLKFSNTREILGEELLRMWFGNDESFPEVVVDENTNAIKIGTHAYTTGSVTMIGTFYENVRYIPWTGYQSSGDIIPFSVALCNQLANNLIIPKTSFTVYNGFLKPYTVLNGVLDVPYKDLLLFGLNPNGITDFVDRIQLTQSGVTGATANAQIKMQSDRLLASYSSVATNTAYNLNRIAKQEFVLPMVETVVV